MCVNLVVSKASVSSLFSCLAELGFLLGGMLLPNNSRVLLSVIGEGSSALFCLTDREACCSGSNNRGAWKSPSGSSVSESSSSDSFYVVKGFSSVQLNRRSSVTEPTGAFTCLIPSANNSAAQSLFIGIFNDIEGIYIVYTPC